MRVSQMIQAVARRGTRRLKRMRCHGSQRGEVAGEGMGKKGAMPEAGGLECQCSEPGVYSRGSYSRGTSVPLSRYWPYLSILKVRFLRLRAHGKV